MTPWRDSNSYRDMKNAAQVVAMLLEVETVRVCSACERERGIPPEPWTPGSTKSHGQCRRHALAAYAEAGMDTAKLAAMPDSAFAPDLSALREDRACHDCERERYGATREGSHGQCKRHWLAWARQQGFTEAQVAEVVREVEAGQGWPPDLGARV